MIYPTDLIIEIKSDLKTNGYTVDDIYCIGDKNGEYGMSWEDFYDKFKGVKYDSRSGSQIIAVDLVIFMKDGSKFVRDEVDNYEFWQYINCIRPDLSVAKKMNVISSADNDCWGYSTVKELNEGEFDGD